MFPQTQRVRLVRGSLCGCDLTTSISSKGMQGQANEKSARAHKQTTCPGNHPRSTPQKPMLRATFVTCSRTSQTDGYRRPRRTGFLPQKKSPKKPINRMCLGEESTDEATQSGISISITESKVDGDGASNRDKGGNVHLTRL